MGYKKWLFPIFLAILPACFGAVRDGSSHLDMAIEAHKRGFYSLSNSQLEKHISQNPGSGDLDYAYLLSAANHVQMGEYEKGISKLIFLKDNYPDSLYLKDALSYLVLSYLKAGNYVMAVSAYVDYSGRFGPDEFTGRQVEDALFRQAVFLFNSGKAPESKTLLELFSEKFGKSRHISSVNYYMGLAYYGENDFQKAAGLLKKALRGRNSIVSQDILADIHLKLGDCLFNLKDYRGALDSYSNVLKDFPGSRYETWASFQMALIEKRRDNLPKSEALLSGIKEKAGPDLKFKIFSELANIKMLRGDWEAARNQLVEITKDFPDDPGIPEVFMQLGFVSFNMKNFTESISFFDTALKNASSPQVREKSYFGLGYAHYTGGDLSEGFRIWDKLFSEFPGSQFISEVLFLKGKKHYEKKEYAPAEAVLERFIRDYPSSSLYRNGVAMLAESLLAQMKVEKTIRVCEDFLSRSKDEFISFLYGKALYLSRDFGRSISVFSRMETRNPALLAESLYYLGRMHEYEGRIDKAQENYLEIITFYKKFPEWVKAAEEALKGIRR